MKKVLSINKFFTLFMVGVLLIACLILPLSPAMSAFAATAYSDVLEDLRIDEAFDVEAYPSKTDDYSVSVETLAESSNGELFVYCYIPYAEKSGLEATSINISTAINDNLKYENYKLRLLSKSGTLSKYLVEGLKVKTDAVRYYDISTVYRKHYKDIDGVPMGNSVVSEKAFSVGKCYTACTLNNTVTYSCTGTKVVTLKDEFIGYMRCPLGLSFLAANNYECDSHFVSFNTDYDIKSILEADIKFRTQSVQCDMAVTSPWYKVAWLGIRTWFGYEPTLDDVDYTYNFTYGEKEAEFVSLNYKDNATVTEQGLFNKHSYSWDRIQSTESFIANMQEQGCKFSSEELASLRKGAWVFQFYETPYTSNANAMSSSATGNYTKVSDVQLLRFKFETEEGMYNLGVVSDKMTGSQVGSFNHGDENLRKVLAVIFGIVFVFIFIWILKFLLKKAK